MAKISDELRRQANCIRSLNSKTHTYKDPCKIERLADRIDAEMVELPKDAHGEYIRVGDTLDGYVKTIEVVEMRYGRGGWVLISRDGSGYADTFAFAHHHEPTVEDVLREFADEVWNRYCNGTTASDSGIRELEAEYAARLMLAGEDA